MILDNIIEKKLQTIANAKAKVPLKEIESELARVKILRRDFKSNISKSGAINIIAEVKKASPSKGLICENFDHRDIARKYEFSEAAAISVLTEKDFFRGSRKYLQEVREVTCVPVLRKDFIIDKYQLYETALLGADAVLLIAAILSSEEIKEYIKILKTFDIDALVEVHTQEDLHKALNAEAEIIGINNRDLYTFNVSLKTTENIIRNIPNDKIVVSESGITTHEDIQRLRSIGVNAFLIGESLVKSENIIDKLNNLRGVS